MSDSHPERDDKRSFWQKFQEFLHPSPDTPDALIETLAEAEDKAIISPEALAMLEGVIRMADRTAGDIMVPAPRMDVLDIHAPFEALLDQVIRTAHSRFPVYEGARENIIGVLMAKDLLKLQRSPTLKLRALLRPVNFIPETKGLYDLLREFRSNHYHLSIVVDEFGRVAGLITIEDVIEQIVGEIEDEFDIAGDEGDIFGLSDHTYRVSGDTPVERVCEAFGVSIRSSDPEEDFDTIGGLIAHELGHVPRRGEQIALAGLHFVVLHTKGGAVRWFKVSTQGPASNDPGTAEDASA